MSDYVTNLVRRSVGLAPLVAPLAQSMPFVPEVIAEAPAAAPKLVAHPTVESPGASVVAAPAQIHVHSVQGPIVIPVAAQPAQIEPIREKGRTPERELVVAVPPSIETTIVMPASTVSVFPAAIPLVEPAHARAAVTQTVMQSVAALLQPPTPDLPAPIVLPARAEPAPSAEPTPRAVVPFETVRELSHRLDQVVEPAAAAIAPIALPPVSNVAPRVERVPEMPAPENRVVQVRIGSIEIHGAAPVASAPAPVTSSALAPRIASSGFDQFVRLRSYAQWEW